VQDHDVALAADGFHRHLHLHDARRVVVAVEVRVEVGVLDEVVVAHDRDALGLDLVDQRRHVRADRDEDEHVDALAQQVLDLVLLLGLFVVRPLDDQLGSVGLRDLAHIRLVKREAARDLRRERNADLDGLVGQCGRERKQAYKQRDNHCHRNESLHDDALPII